MDTTEIAVMAGGAAPVLFLLWFFFGEREAVAAAAGAGGVQEIDITVRGGYTPDRVVVRAGSPVRLNFYRDEADSCGESVVFGDFRVARQLPAFKKTAVEFTWTCGMSMMRGKLVVQ
jgi:plastocyanin domain-containing protein